MSLRICFVSYLLSRQATGLSSYMCAVSAKLVDAGHQVTVLATDLEYGGKALEGGVKLDPRVQLQIFQVRGAFNRRLYRCPLLVAWLQEHASEFDVVDIQGIWALVNLEAAQAIRKLGLPYVVTPHGMLTHWDWQKRRLFKNLLFALSGRSMLDGAAALRFLAQGELKATATRITSRVEVIPNAVEPHLAATSAADLETLRLRLGMSPGDTLVLFLGRISHQKGVMELVQAMGLLPSTSRLHLAIIGPNDQEPEYAAQVRAEAIASPAARRIHMVGPLFGEEKYVYLKAADLFATVSRNEGLSLAALEAMAEGLALVITEAANLPEVAAWNAGRIVAQDSTAVAAAFTELTADADILARHKEQARQLFHERFSWDVVLPKLVALYEKVSAGS